MLVFLHLALEGAIAHRLVAHEVDASNLHLGPFVHVEREVHELGAAGNFLDLGRHRRELKALLLQHVLHDPLNLAHEARVDEGVEPDDGVGLFQLLVDLRGLDFFRPHVIDDLDSLPLLHVVGDDLSHHTIGERVVAHVDPKVVEEVRRPQAPEIFEDRLFSGVGVRHPDALRRLARLELDVIKVGLIVDQRRPALRFETRRDKEHHRTGVGRRQRARRRHLLAADGNGRGRLRLSRRGGLLGSDDGRPGADETHQA